MMDWFFSSALAVLLSVVIIYSLYASLISYHSALSPPSSELASPPSLPSGPATSQTSAAPECAEGSKTACTLASGCEGKNVCLDGKWSGCLAPLQVCVPGSQKGCTFVRNDVCGAGMSTCNACGTAWGECS
ncbi:Uncharacterised protein [Candidatus Burarchaeum australiense]|nr:Uncharacterised protein [Candidatus Burarchaeum australiense]